MPSELSLNQGCLPNAVYLWLMYVNQVSYSASSLQVKGDNDDYEEEDELIARLDMRRAPYRHDF